MDEISDEKELSEVQNTFINALVNRQENNSDSSTTKRLPEILFQLTKNAPNRHDEKLQNIDYMRFGSNIPDNLSFIYQQSKPKGYFLIFFGIFDHNFVVLPFQ